MKAKFYSKETCGRLEDIPNVGKEIANDLRFIGVATPEALKRKDAHKLYTLLEKRTQAHHDPCVLDTFMAAVDYVNGAPRRPWWHYTKLRKQGFGFVGLLITVAAIALVLMLSMSFMRTSPPQQEDGKTILDGIEEAEEARDLLNERYK